MAQSPSDKEHLEYLPPGARLLGRRVVATNLEAGTVDLEFDASDQFSNRHGTIQGGFLAAMLDAAVGLAGLQGLPEGESVVTLDLHVSYIAPAVIGVIQAKGAVTQRSRTIMRANAELRSETGGIIATAVATLRIIRTTKP